jgi:DNA repair ATPase RecN
MVKCPMYGLLSEERRKVARNCAKYLDEELHSLKFEMAIFMGKTTFKLVKGLLKLDFPYRVVPLPFRSVASFKKELEKVLATLSISPHE